MSTARPSIDRGGASERLCETLARGRPIAGHGPVPRVVLDRIEWVFLIDRLRREDWTLLGFWGVAWPATPAPPPPGDGATVGAPPAPEVVGEVHLALRDEIDGAIAVVSLDCPDGHFPAIGQARPAAIRLERSVWDLCGLSPVDPVDDRPWLDHGQWAMLQPLGLATPVPAAAPRPAATDYTFLPVTGPERVDGRGGLEELHQIPVGPVHAGIIEPGHFRFHCHGETVVRMEARLGYVHKGVERLLAGKTPVDAARIAGRLSGDSTVAFAWAWAQAVEAAQEMAPPPRALLLRAVMAELERIANHLGDIGAICNDAAFALIQQACAELREDCLRAAASAFGHRLMMDRIVPGGVTVALTGGGEESVRGLLDRLPRRFEAIVHAYGSKPSLLDRTIGTGILAPQLAHRFGAGGFVGRASGRGTDIRRSPGYAPYDALDVAVPVRQDGDVHARLMVRVEEVWESRRLLLALLDRMAASPAPLMAEPPRLRAGEGLGLVEGFRGDCLAWVRLDRDGRVARGHLRDPSWFQWPLLEVVLQDNIVADFPLCNKSFNCSYSGHDS